MPQPIPLLINPKAGSLFRSGLKAWLDDHRDAFRAVPTRSAEDLTNKARELAFEKFSSTGFPGAKEENWLHTPVAEKFAADYGMNLASLFV